MLEIEQLKPNELTVAARSEFSALEALKKAYLASPDQEELDGAVMGAASLIAANLHDPLYYIQHSNDYYYIRNTLIQKWFEISFETRMMLREMAIAIDRTRSLLQSLPPGAHEALFRALGTISPAALALFVFSTRIDSLMADDIKKALASDDEVRNAPTSGTIWSVSKQLFPGLEERLRQPLDRSKYVKRDPRKEPRQNTK